MKQARYTNIHLKVIWYNVYVRACVQVCRCSSVRICMRVLCMCICVYVYKCMCMFMHVYVCAYWHVYYEYFSVAWTTKYPDQVIFMKANAILTVVVFNMCYYRTAGPSGQSRLMQTLRIQEHRRLRHQTGSILPQNAAFCITKCNENIPILKLSLQ